MKPETLFPALGRLYMMLLLAVAIIDVQWLWVAYTIAGGVLIATMLLWALVGAVRSLWSREREL